MVVVYEVGTVRGSGISYVHTLPRTVSQHRNARRPASSHSPVETVPHRALRTVLLALLPCITTRRLGEGESTQSGLRVPVGGKLGWLAGWEWDEDM